MELPYIQDIAGDKTETPVAPFAKARDKNIVAYVIKQYKNSELEGACLHYYDESGKEIIRGHTCARRFESYFENVLNECGQIVEHRSKNCHGHRPEVVINLRKWKWHKKVTTFSNGYLTSIQYPNAKAITTFQFSNKSKSIYAKTINEKENEIEQRWEQYDVWNRLVSQKYIRHAKDNPAEIYEFDSYSYIYQDNLSPNNHISHVLGMIHLADNMHSMRVVYFDYDKHGNWRTKHIYEYDPDSYNKEILKYVEKRVIAYRNEDMQSVTEAYDEAAYYLNLEQYNDSTYSEDYFNYPQP